MSTHAFRAVGINYIQFSNACARALRNSLKPELQADAVKRDISHIKALKWEDGKPSTAARTAAKSSG